MTASKEATQSTLSTRSRIWPLVLACCLFLVNNLDLLRAWLQPPAGTRPMYVRRDIDVAIHLTWMNGLRSHWLIPNYDLPFVTKPGLFAPLMTVLGRITAIGVDPALLYTAAQFLAYLVGAYALFAGMRLFLTSRRQMYAAALCILCVCPLGDVLRFMKGLAVHNLKIESLFGFPSYEGFVLPGSLTMTIGTVSVLLALALLASYIRTGNFVFLLSTGLTAGMSGLFHPFETVAIMAGAASSIGYLRWPRVRVAIREALTVCVPGVMALSLYAYFSFRTRWIARLATMNAPEPLNPVRLLYRLGIPAILACLILVIGPRMRKSSDVILQCWFAATLLVMMIPKLPFRFHLVDGLSVVTALLVVRQFSTISFLQSWVARHRRFALAVGGLVIAVSAAMHLLTRYADLRDGNRLSGPVASEEETATVNWLRRNAHPEELVLAPPDSAPWIATVPIHSFASHPLFGFDYPAQMQLARDFYDGKMDSAVTYAFLSRYGINYVVVSANSPVRQFLDQRHEVARILSWTIYYFPEHRMTPYEEAGSLP